MVLTLLREFGQVFQNPKSLRQMYMAQYVETKRFLCSSATGRLYTVIEQILTARATQNVSKEPRTDYITEDGEIAERLDDSSFLLLISDEVIHVA